MGTVDQQWLRNATVAGLFERDSECEASRIRHIWLVLGDFYYGSLNSSSGVGTSGWIGNGG